MTLRQNSLAALGISATLYFLCSIMATSPRASADSSKDVVVTPLPLPVTGTVGITGTATVANTAVSPLWVRDVESPVRTPLEISAEYAPGNQCTNCTNMSTTLYPVTNVVLFDLAPVPPGKRWVVKHISGLILGTNPIILLQTQRDADFPPRRHIKLAISSFFRLDSPNTPVFGNEVFTTYGPGEVPHVYVADPVQAGGNITRSGYLIDVN
jgi:hypothetical protein